MNNNTNTNTILNCDNLQKTAETKLNKCKNNILLERLQQYSVVIANADTSHISNKQLKASLDKFATPSNYRPNAHANILGFIEAIKEDNKRGELTTITYEDIKDTILNSRVADTKKEKWIHITTKSVVSSVKIVDCLLADKDDLQDVTITKFGKSLDEFRVEVLTTISKLVTSKHDINNHIIPQLITMGFITNKLANNLQDDFDKTIEELKQNITDKGIKEVSNNEKVLDTLFVEPKEVTEVTEESLRQDVIDAQTKLDEFINNRKDLMNTKADCLLANISKIEDIIKKEIATKTTSKTPTTIEPNVLDIEDVLKTIFINKYKLYNTKNKFNKLLSDKKTINRLTTIGDDDLLTAIKKVVNLQGKFDKDSLMFFKDNIDKACYYKNKFKKDNNEKSLKSFNAIVNNVLIKQLNDKANNILKKRRNRVVF